MIGLIFSPFVPFDVQLDTVPTMCFEQSRTRRSVKPLSATVPNLLFIPPSVLSSCAIGFVLPAGLGHPIGASRSQRSGGGTVGWGSWIPCSTTRCESGWRLSLPSRMRPCALQSCERVRAGRYSLRHHPAGALGPFSCRTAPGSKAVQETGVPVTHSCIFDHAHAKHAGRPCVRTARPAPLPQKGASLCLHDSSRGQSAWRINPPTWPACHASDRDSR